MITELFNSPFNRYKDDPVELESVSEDSPKKISFHSSQSTTFRKLREEKLQWTPYQVKKLIEALVGHKYK
jgi:hypothetical protein